MANITMDSAGTPVDLRSSYIALVARRRLYSFILIAVFLFLFFGGFFIADDRNAGGFWDGLAQTLDFPAEAASEAWENLDQMTGTAEGNLTLLGNWWRDLVGGEQVKTDAKAGYLLEFLPSLLETINIAAASTLLGALLAVVFSLLATRGLARWPALVGVFRRMLDISRAVPEIVIALVLIFILGGGPVPAMIAIAFHTVGALGKLFSEVNENADLKPVEGLSSVGATWLQRMWLGVLPQVAPNYLSYALLRFEINIRASAILGFVGAGGIGYDLRNAMSWGKGRYDEAMAIFLLLFVTIVVVDQLSSWGRNKLVGSSR